MVCGGSSAGAKASTCPVAVPCMPGAEGTLGVMHPLEATGPHCNRPTSPFLLLAKKELVSMALTNGTRELATGSGEGDSDFDPLEPEVNRYPPSHSSLLLTPPSSSHSPTRPTAKTSRASGQTGPGMGSERF